MGGLWIYEGVASSGKQQAPISLGLLVESRRVRAIVKIEWPRGTKVGYGISEGFGVVYIEVTRIISKPLIRDRLEGESQDVFIG